MFTCGTCWKEFPSGRNARDQHCASTGHDIPRFECDTCSSYFNSGEARWQHMNDRNHFEFNCSMCSETWPTEEQLKEHEINEHCYCAECDRTFMNPNNTRMHVNSRVHRGESIQCPFCDHGYASVTGFTHHLEKGSCPNAPHLDRDSIYRLIRSRDPNGVISKNLIGWNGSLQYEATEKAYNPYNGTYDCYFCECGFKTLHGLNQHLASPRHQANLYHCPNRGCSQEFTTLAATINHLESESCGFMTFDAVQRNMNNLISSNRRLEFR